MESVELYNNVPASFGRWMESMLSMRSRYVFILLGSLFFFAVFEFVRVGDFVAFTVSEPILLATTLYIFATVWEGNRLIVRKVNSIIPPEDNSLQAMWKRFGIILPAGTLYSVAVVLLPGVLLGWMSGLPYEDYDVPLKSFSIFSFIVMIMLHTANTTYYYIMKWQDTLVEAERFKKLSMQSQFEALRSQVNPHFMFNSLNTLTSLIYKDRDSAADFVHRLSSVYRYILQHQNDEVVELSRELEFIQAYSYLLKTRFAENIHIAIRVTPEVAAQSLIPPVTLQMLVENAVKHNIVSRNKPLRIDIFLEDEYTLTVRNTLQRKQYIEHSTRIGLKNITSRYSFLTRHPVRISEDTAFFTVRLPLLFS